MRPFLTGLLAAMLAAVAGAPHAFASGGGAGISPAECPCAARALRYSPRPPSDVPLGHWAYPLLERLAARGVIVLDLTTLPVSREAVATALAARRAGGPASGESALSERERWAIGRLEAEFLRLEVDAPILSVRDGEAVLGLGLVLGTEARYSENDDTAVEVVGRRAESEPEDDFSMSVDWSYELWGGLGNGFGFYSDATVILEGQDGPRVSRLSSRARTWRGIAATVDRAYAKYERPYLALTVGRWDPAWGRSRTSGLLISGTAPTLDGLEARFSVGPLTCVATHALLERPASGEDGRADEDERVFFAAHRLVFAGGWGSVGLAEAVVYGSTIPDATYLNPLFPYYLAQHNEREDDNVVWSLDFVSRPLRGLELYGEALVDDLQYERNTENPDKYGVTVGALYCGSLLERDYELTAEYTNVRKWTYTHQVPEHAITHDGVPLGFELGPDADRLRLKIVHHPSSAWSVGLEYVYSRLGEGTITEPFVHGGDDEPTFPSGNVTRVQRAAVELSYDTLNDLWATFGAAYEHEEDDLTDGDGFELRATVRFRI